MHGRGRGRSCDVITQRRRRRIKKRKERLHNEACDENEGKEREMRL